MAAKAFGDGAIFLERFVPKARHVEIQIFGFGDGDAVHLFERDCSLQRRFQKVIEESPAPGLPREVQARMADAALNLCRATRYRGAGTVEFIVDAESFDFYRSEEHTSELQSLMRISYAVFCLKKKMTKHISHIHQV